jgi:hypothetical protein
MERLPMRRFENIRVFAVPIPPFSRCQCAVTLPGIGILVSPDVTDDVALLRHEFGHILQRRKFGWLFFWFRIAPLSLYSCLCQSFCTDYHHADTWTEWSANRLSFVYFGHPADWKVRSFPFRPSVSRPHSAFPSK